MNPFKKDTSKTNLTSNMSFERLIKRHLRSSITIKYKEIGYTKKLKDHITNVKSLIS